MTTRVNRDLDQLLGAFRVFLTPENTALLFDNTHRRWIEGLASAVRQMAHELTHGVPSLTSEFSDAVDVLNSIQPFLLQRGATVWTDGCLLEMLVQRRIISSSGTGSPDLEYWLLHACALSEKLPEIFTAWRKKYRSEIAQRLHPSWDAAFDQPSVFGHGILSLETLRESVIALDPFENIRAFRTDGTSFFPAQLDSIPSRDRFFGFESLRAQIAAFVDDFAAGRANVPLLISGLPGLGKTHLPISEVLAHKELTLILAGPEVLEKSLESVFTRLAARPYRRFVLFVDDIDPRKLDWYAFRTHVGGSFSLPDNLTMVISSNYLFPANITSRGKTCRFPLFDHHRCTEMIFDYLKRMGIKKPSENLVTVMAADYTEQCGQKVFEDVSPRTLMRYLNSYEGDTAKRKRMLDYANSDVISRPDPDLFFESNIRRMRALHGETAIDELREQMLREYGL